MEVHTDDSLLRNFPGIFPFQAASSSRDGQRQRVTLGHAVLSSAAANIGALIGQILFGRSVFIALAVKAVLIVERQGWLRSRSRLIRQCTSTHFDIV